MGCGVAANGLVHSRIKLQTSKQYLSNETKNSALREMETTATCCKNAVKLKVRMLAHILIIGYVLMYTCALLAAGLFQAHIKYLLVLTTPQQIVLLGVCLNGTYLLCVLLSICGLDIPLLVQCV